MQKIYKRNFVTVKFAFDSQVWTQYYSVEVNPPFLSILVQCHLSLAFLN